MTDELRAGAPTPSAIVRSRRALPPFATLRAFDAVARLGGIRKAAEALLVDHAAVSRHLRTLEDWTGAALVIRDATRTAYCRPSAVRVTAQPRGLSGVYLFVSPPERWKSLPVTRFRKWLILLCEAELNPAAPVPAPAPRQDIRP